MQSILKMIQSATVGHKYSLDELVHIVRPVIYVWCVMKFGRKSYIPIKISFALDVIHILISAVRLVRSNQYENKNSKKSHFILSVVEKNEIMKRIRASILKYIVRDPIFTDYFKFYLEKVCRLVRVPEAIVTYLLAYINYYRFYSYIA